MVMRALTKICSRCKREKPLNEQYFTLRTDSGTWRGQCKRCVANRIREQRKQSGVRERELAARAARKKANPEKWREQNRNAARRWREKYPEKVQELRKKHAARRKISTEKWMKKNPHWAAMYQRRRRFRLKNPLVAKISKWLFRVNQNLSRRFNSFDLSAQKRLARGIMEHIKACKKVGIGGQKSTIVEMMNDAQKGVFMFEEIRQRKEPIADRNYAHVYQDSF